ncbi:MAG: ATP-binding protein [Caldilineaceae bacterium]
MFRSIRWRLVASYTLMTILAVTLVGMLALFLIERYLVRQERDYLTLNAATVARQIEPLLRTPIAQPALQELARTTAFLSDVQVRILDAKEQPLADSGLPSQLDGVTWLLPPEAFAATEELDLPLPPAEVDVLVQILSAQENVQRPFVWQRELLRRRRNGEPLSPPIVVFRRGADSAPVPLATASPPPSAPTQSADPAAPSPTVQRWADIDTLFVAAAPAPQRVVQQIGAGGDLLGYVELSSGLASGVAALVLIRRAFLLAGLGVSLLAVVVVLWMSRSVTAPLHELIQATEQMRSGTLSTRAIVQTRDEIGLLATQFNTMAARLESSFAALAAERDALRRFVADASHELRTPITALKTFGELLLGPAGESEPTRTEFLQESQKQIQRLEWMTSALLKLSRLDAGLTDLKIEQVDLRDLLATAVKPFAGLVQERALTLSLVDAADPIVVLCNPAYLELALANLLDNALKFTPSGGLIQVGATGQGPWAELWVCDNGPGIAPEDRPYIFDRFYRGLHTVSPHTAEGSGLGLAIVESIVKAHGGQVAVQSGVGTGSRFAMKLPQPPNRFP